MKLWPLPHYIRIGTDPPINTFHMHAKLCCYGCLAVHDPDTDLWHHLWLRQRYLHRARMQLRGRHQSDDNDRRMKSIGACSPRHGTCEPSTHVHAAVQRFYHLKQERRVLAASANPQMKSVAASASAHDSLQGLPARYAS